MPDNWGYVLAAYGLAVVVLGGYWRYLLRRDRELTALLHRAGRRRTPARDDSARMEPTDRSDVEQQDKSDLKQRSRFASVPAHPHPEPGSRHPLP